MNQKASTAGIAVLFIALLSFASVLGATQLVTQTTTVSGPCTGTATLNDGSPSGLTTTYVSPCTGTITYQSTTTITTSTTTMNPEVIYHVNGGPSCPVLGIVADVNSFRGNFTVHNANGLDMWKVEFNMSDLADNVLAVLSFSSVNQTYSTSQLVYQNGIMIQNTTLPVDYHGPITNGMDIDFYTDGDGGQLFLYAPMQTSILFGHNFPNFLQGPGVPFVSFNDMSMGIVPVHSDGRITFSNLNLNIQMGQQFEQPQPPANIPVQAVNPAITPDPCSLGASSPIDINAVQSVIGPKNNDTLIELSMTSP